MKSLNVRKLTPFFLFYFNFFLCARVGKDASGSFIVTLCKIASTRERMPPYYDKAVEAMEFSILPEDKW